MNREFSDILKALSVSGAAYFSRTVGGRVYTRAFFRPERLILLGAGHVARAVAELAAKLDFAVTVVDDRPEFANHQAFPAAEAVICAPFDQAIRDRLHIGARDFVCILTRGHRYDGECLRAILPGEMPAYLGMIGSRKRTGEMLALLKNEGFDDARLAAVHTPIGLPIKAESPMEIAVSIMAEVILTRRSIKKPEGLLAQSGADTALLTAAANAKIRRALMLVLDARGSTPVSSGAMMLLLRDGRYFGTVGGGCGEAAAMQKAYALMGTGRGEVLELALTGDVAADEGMVCGGNLRFWIEDLSAPEDPAMEESKTEGSTAV